MDFIFDWNIKFVSLGKCVGVSFVYLWKRSTSAECYKFDLIYKNDVIVCLS